MPEQHLCAKCAEEDPELTRKPRPVVNQRRPYWCATHRRGELVRQGKVRRATQIERTYQISAEDAHELFLLQQGRCWLCQKATGATKSLAIDHDHETGEVRGRLCGPCNQFIGRLGDDPGAARRLTGYLSGDTPYRRLKALQAFSSVYGEPVVVDRVWLDQRSQRLAAEWGRTETGAKRFELVPVFDGTCWSTDPTPTVAVADSEPRVETPGECSSCHALPDQPHTEYCETALTPWLEPDGR